MITDLEICYGRGSEEKLQLRSHDLSCINFVVIEGIVVSCIESILIVRVC